VRVIEPERPAGALALAPAAQARQSRSEFVPRGYVAAISTRSRRRSRGAAPPRGQARAQLVRGRSTRSSSSTSILNRD